MAEETDPNVQLLRDAGHEEAADVLERAAAKRADEELLRQGPGQVRPPGINLLSDDVGGHSPAEVEAARGMLAQVNALKQGQTFSVPMFDDQGRR